MPLLRQSSPSSTIEVIGLGALNIDHIYKVERILKDGETVVEEAGSFTGGSAANTIFGLAKLGINTGFIGAVGDDGDGRLMIRDFNKVGVDTSQIKTKPEARTGSTLCLSDRASKRSIYVMPGANNLLTADDTDVSYVNQARILHISSFVGEQQLEFLLELITKLDSSVKIGFSPGALYASKGLPALTPLLAKTYILFINESEMRQLTGKGFSSGAKICLEQGCHTVVVTLGRGKRQASTRASRTISYIRDSQNSYVIETRGQKEAPAVDATGAGDAFAAGFLYGWLKGKDPEQCGLLGDIVARFSITQHGARGGLPTLGQLAQSYRRLYRQQL